MRILSKLQRMIKRIARIEFLLIDAARLASTGHLDAARARLLQADEAICNAKSSVPADILQRLLDRRRSLQPTDDSEK